MNRKCIRLFILLSSVVFQSLIAQNIDSLVDAADKSYKIGRFVESAVLLERAISAGSNDPVVLYNASCCFALSGRKEKAWIYLEDAFKNGFTNAEHMKNDTDLASLRSDPRWKKMLDKMKPGNIQENYDALVNDMNNIAAFLFQYRIRPESMGGGGSKYFGAVLPARIASNDNGSFSIDIIDNDNVDITGTSKFGYGTIKAGLNSEGRFSKWEYSGEFKTLKK